MTFHPGLVDQPAGRVTLRVPEHRPCVASLGGLGGGPVVPVALHPCRDLTDLARRSRRQGKAGRTDDVVVVEVG